MAWYKDGQAISGDGERARTTAKGTSITLSIDRVDVGDIANYTCTAKNAYGSDTLTLLLLVSGTTPIIPLPSLAPTPHLAEFCSALGDSGHRIPRALRIANV